MQRILMAFVVFTLLPACMTVSSISISQIPPLEARQTKITSSASDLIVLFIPFGNSFPDRAREALERQCPNGRIEGVLAKHQDTSYLFVSKQEIVMEAYCVTAVADAAKRKTHPAATSAKSSGPKSLQGKVLAKNKGRDL